MATKTISKNKKIRKGDKVVAIAGNNRGQIGTVLARSGDKVVVQGLNIRKKHVKRSQQNTAGGIIEIEKPIHISNLKVCNENDQPMKLKVAVDDNGERQLVYRDDHGNDIVYRSLKKS